MFFIVYIVKKNRTHGAYESPGVWLVDVEQDMIQAQAKRDLLMARTILSTYEVRESLKGVDGLSGLAEPSAAQYWAELKGGAAS